MKNPPKKIYNYFKGIKQVTEEITEIEKRYKEESMWNLFSDSTTSFHYSGIVYNSSTFSGCVGYSGSTSYSSWNGMKDRCCGTQGTSGKLGTCGTRGHSGTSGTSGLKKKNKEIKRIYSEVDPYGEENWEE